MNKKDLEEFSVEQLEKLKEKWYGDAVSREMFSKISVCAAELGEKVGNTISTYRYIDQKVDLVILISESEDYEEVLWKSKTVCNTHRTSKIYIPGPWEEWIEKLYLKAEKEKLHKVNQENEKIRKKLIDNLSLPE